MMRRHEPNCRRPGTTMMETLIALAALATGGVIAAQLATSALAERSRSDTRLEAIEAAANVLEQARARPWAELTPDWASAAKLPSDLAKRWPDGELTVRVETEKGQSGIKRVTVEVRAGGAGARSFDRPVTMMALFASRTAGGKP